MPWLLRSRSILGAGRLVCCVGFSFCPSATGQIEPTPFGGVPHSVPGGIEAEEFDLGGEGVAFHSAGSVLAHLGGEIPRGRPDAEIAVSGVEPGIGPDQVWLREGEWLSYSLNVTEAGYYTFLFYTMGPPRYAQFAGSCPDGPFWQRAPPAGFHLELDGHPVTESIAGEARAISPRLWMSAGPHLLRLVVSSVADVFALDMFGTSEPGAMRLFTFPVDRMEIIPSPFLVHPERFAGGEEGFQDGTGAEARFGYWTHLIGEARHGDLLLYDEHHTAYRTVSRQGVVRTLAGSPGNPPRDGTGTQAGFGFVRQSVVRPWGGVLVLESDPEGRNRIAAVDEAGYVSTLFSGTVVVTLNESVPGWRSMPTHLPVTLSQITLTDTGEIEALGAFEESILNACGPFQILYTEVFPWHVRCRIADGNATVVALQRLPLPPLAPGDLGEGFRLEGYHLVQETPEGFVHPVLPDIAVISTLRTSDGQRWGMIDGALHRLTADPSAGFLRVEAEVGGRISTAPTTPLRPGQEVLLEAEPTLRFSRFVRWSDGNSENPRRFQFLHETTLAAQFEVQYPEPHGIDPHSVTLDRDGYFRCQVVGAEQPYYYTLEQSTDLKTWGPAVGPHFSLEGAGSVQNGLLVVAQPEAQLRVFTGRPAHYFRVSIQNR